MNLSRAVHPTRLRLIVLTAVLAVAGLLAATTQAASARTGPRETQRSPMPSGFGWAGWDSRVNRVTKDVVAEPRQPDLIAA